MSSSEEKKVKCCESFLKCVFPCSFKEPSKKMTEPRPSDSDIVNPEPPVPSPEPPVPIPEPPVPIPELPVPIPEPPVPNPEPPVPNPEPPVPNPEPLPEDENLLIELNKCLG